MRNVRRVGPVTAAALAAVTLCAACGSSGGATSRSAQHTSASTSTGLAVGEKAPDALVVATLMTADTLRGAGLTAQGPEDDGGAGESGTFTSQVQTIIGGRTQITASLTSYGSATDAIAAYQQDTGSATPAPIAGVGDQAASVGQDAYVRKGSQVLAITGRLSPEAEKKVEDAKAKGGPIPTEPYTDAGEDATAVAKAVGAKLTGQSATKTYVELPAGAIDPCFSASGLAKLGPSGATEQNVLAEDPPAQQCAYRFGTAGYLQVETLTSTQTAVAVPPTSLKGDFDKRVPIGGVGGATSGGTTFGSGPLSGRDIGAPGDFDVVLYLDPTVDSMMEIYEEPSGSFTPEDKCEEYMRYLLDDWAQESGFDPLAPGAAQVYNDALQKLTQACKRATGN